MLSCLTATFKVDLRLFSEILSEDDGLVRCCSTAFVQIIALSVCMFLAEVDLKKKSEKHTLVTFFSLTFMLIIDTIIDLLLVSTSVTSL